MTDWYGSPSELEVISIGDLLARPDEDIQWVVEDRLPTAGTSVLAAKPKVGKSTLARGLSLAVGRGDPWLGSKTTEGVVLYLALEEKISEVRNHFLAMGATGNERLSIVPNLPIQNPLDSVRELIIQHRPVLVVADTLQQIARIRDLNSYGEVHAHLDPYRRLAKEFGTHIMFLHHSRKGEASADNDEILGSIAIQGIVDTMIILRRKPHCRTIRTSQRYGVDLEESSLLFDDETRTPHLAGAVPDFETSRIESAILLTLTGLAEPISREEIEHRVTGRTEILRRALPRLVNARKVIQTGSGRRGDPYWYALPASTTEEPADSCSLVPPLDTGQETTNCPTGERGDSQHDSCSPIRVAAGEQGNTIPGAGAGEDPDG